MHIIKVFRRLAEISHLSGTKRDEYEASLKRYRDTLNAIAGAEQKGRAEEALNIARNLKNMNLSIEDIMKATRLSAEEIERL